MTARRLTTAALLATLLAPAWTRAGVPLRNDEARPHSVIEPLKEPDGFLPQDVRSVWVRFLDAIESARGRIPKPAVEREGGPRSPDLGDDFLIGFAREKGLRRKLRTLSTYKATLGRAGRWLATLEPSHQQALQGGMMRLSREAGAAEQILVKQVIRDGARGGKALEVVIDHIQGMGFVEEVARDAFGGMERGLRQAYMMAKQGGKLSTDVEDSLARQLEVLRRLVRGR